MNPEQIQYEKQAIVDRFGEWTAHRSWRSLCLSRHRHFVQAGFRALMLTL